MELNLDRVNERIIEEFPATKIVEEVFCRAEEQSRFIESLSKLSETGVIKAGGRRIRTLLGCKTFDFSEHVVDDALYSLEEIQKVRLGPLVQILKDFPVDRMVNPDLDFFTEGIEIEKTADVLKSNGFDVCVNTATGGVKIVEVKGSKGTATFIDSNDSWQTQPPWPMFGGIFAKFSLYPNSKFNLDIGHGRLHEYPLEFSGPGMASRDPIDPQRFAAVGRILLWSVTATNPNGMRLTIPYESSREIIYETVSHLFKVIQMTKNDPILKKTYSMGIRDMALALRVIELSDWDELSRISKNFGEEERGFMNRVSSSWWQGRK